MPRSRIGRTGPVPAPTEGSEPAQTRLIGRVAAGDMRALEQRYRADGYNGRSKVCTWTFAIAYRKALKALSDDHRGVVELSYFLQGMGYREIAQIVDRPVDTVKTRMFHARRRRLRTLLAGPAEDWL